MCTYLRRQARFHASQGTIGSHRLMIYAFYPTTFFPLGVYVNDLPEAPRNCSTEDDTKFFVSFHSQGYRRIVKGMNEDLLPSLA